MVTGLQLPLISFSSFLWRGFISASLRFFLGGGNFVKFIELLKLVQRKSRKNHCSTELWDTLLTPWFKIKCSTSLLPTSVNLKLSLFLHWFLMVTIFGWFLYFRVAFIIEYMTLSKKDHLECLQFLDLLSITIFIFIRLVQVLVRGVYVDVARRVPNLHLSLSFESKSAAHRLSIFLLFSLKYIENR